MKMRSIKTIAVFCGSNYGASEEFADGARALGRVLGKAGITIVYGGTTKGLMGIVANAALASGGYVHGVITNNLHERGQLHSGLTKHEVALTLRSRKERMVQLADAFIALPGGIGRPAGARHASVGEPAVSASSCVAVTWLTSRGRP
jgi:uncharacterized protein (TIGR00730 family)